MGNAVSDAVSKHGQKQASSVAGMQKQFAGQILKGKLPPAFQTAIENQYTTAKNQAMDFLPRGGELNSALNTIDLGRAQQITNLPATLLPIAMGGLGQAEQTYANVGGMQQQKNMGIGQGVGQFLTTGQIGSPQSSSSQQSSASKVGPAFQAAGK